MAKSASISALAIAAAIAAAIGISVASAQRAPGDAAAAAQRAPLGGNQTANPAAQNFLAEHEIGHRFHFGES